jgi:hypothetical protein
MSDKKTWTANDVLDVMMRGMGDFQIKQFVVNAQMTPIKQLHQAAMEIEVREENLRKGDFDDKKQRLKIEVMKKRRDRTTDDLEQAELDLEIHQVEEKLILIAREKVRMQYELKSFYEIMDYFNDNFDIEHMLSMKDTLEIDYWVKRLAKQAALDLVSTGRISNGNLSSMMDMPDEIFQISLQETFKLTNQLAKVVPVPALTSDDSEFLLKFGPTGGTNPDAIAQSQPSQAAINPTSAQQ